MRDALEQVTRYGFDEAGNMDEQIDARSRATTYEYDAAGRRTARTLPLMQRETSRYGLTGAHVGFGGEEQSYVVDRTTDRSLLHELPDDHDVTIGYGADGRRTSASDGTHDVQWLYEGGPQRLLSEVVRNGQTWLTYEHDAAGNRTSTTTHDDTGLPRQRTTYGHDAANRLEWVCEGRTDDGGLGVHPTCPGADCPAARYTYNFHTGRLTHLDYGRLTGTTFTEEVNGTYVHDPLTGGVKRILWEDVIGTDLLDITYTLHEMGRRTGAVETRGATSRTLVWGFDDLYRLTSESVNGVVVREFTYDEVGNRLTQERVVEGTIAYVYDANDRLVSLDGDPQEWSPEGNLEEDANLDYEWDDQDRMVEAGAWTFTYDVDGLEQATQVRAPLSSTWSTRRSRTPR